MTNLFDLAIPRRAIRHLRMFALFGGSVVVAKWRHRSRQQKHHNPASMADRSTAKVKCRPVVCRGLLLRESPCISAAKATARYVPSDVTRLSCSSYCALRRLVPPRTRPPSCRIRCPHQRVGVSPLTSRPGSILTSVEGQAAAARRAAEAERDSGARTRAS